MSEIVSQSLVENKIYLFRGKKVMLSEDLAGLYGVLPKVLNQAVKRNIERFPNDFMFQLTEKEVRFLRSQIVTLETGKGRHSKYLSYAFTEQGVAMLSSVLKSKKAIRVNIEIMRAFARLREILATNKDFARRLEELERKFNAHDHQFQAVFDAIKELMKTPEKPKRRIGFLEESKAVYQAN
jgi:phage regulator Rha-like protein